ncbi:MAG: Gfo/Idh/MocA family oxidoreductase [Treponemataceae bacterium]
MEQIKLALVGCGDYLYNVMYFAMRKLPVRLVGICDIEQKQLERFSKTFNAPAQYASYTEMIDQQKPDAVVCGANAAVHYEVMKYCLLKGVNVFVEKTPCRTAAEAKELTELQKKSRKVAMVGFNRRFATSYMMAKEVIGRAEFGIPAMYYSKFHASPYRSIDYFVFNHIIHHLDLARFFLGDLENISVRHKIYTDTTGVFLVDFSTKAGTVGTIQSACMLQEPFPMERLDIVGTGGRDVVVDNLRSFSYNRTGPARDKKFDISLQNDGDCLAWNPSHGYAYGFDHMGFDAELAAFVSSVSSGAPTGCDIGDCVGSMEAMETVRKAVFA